MPDYQNKKTLRVKIDKLVHGGQGIGTLSDGRKAFVWNALPGEEVNFEVTKSKKDYVEGTASDTLDSSNYRVMPKDELFLSTSPWQILDEDQEDNHKLEILKETFIRQKLNFENIDFYKTTRFWGYRNKMEYSFYGDEAGLHLALFNRGTRRKQIVAGSSIAQPEIDQTATKICEVLDKNKIRASDLKSLIVRCNKAGECVAALFTKDQRFPGVEDLKDVCKGLVVVYSNPKSPASVRTKDLYIFGNIYLSDELAGRAIKYSVFSFFQVNLDVFEVALSEINEFVGDKPVVDMYSGVGTIGLSLKNPKKLVELDLENIEMARQNLEGEKPQIIHASSEKAVNEIEPDIALIVDPPRAGLHKELIAAILEKKPPILVYLSCNPSTQARDLEYLSESYKIKKITGYNFFPRTPHIESLVILSIV